MPVEQSTIPFYIKALSRFDYTWGKIKRVKMLFVASIKVQTTGAVVNESAV